MKRIGTESQLTGSGTSTQQAAVFSSNGAGIRTFQGLASKLMHHWNWTRLTPHSSAVTNSQCTFPLPLQGCIIIIVPASPQCSPKPQMWASLSSLYQSPRIPCPTRGFLDAQYRSIVRYMLGAAQFKWLFNGQDYLWLRWR